jgi:hypothetical protein
MSIEPHKIDFLQRWAAHNKCHLEEKGVVGFGRPCVGIVHESAYVDLPLYGSENFDRDWGALPIPPSDAYHKHDCLAVLAPTEDYDAALEQLYTWIIELNERHFTVKIQDRETYNKEGVGRALELFMGGASQAVLTLEGGQS